MSGLRGKSSFRLWLVVLSFVTVQAAGPQGHWPSFRGPGANGLAEGYPTASTWNLETSENVEWKTPIPGLGHSSPIVWGDRIFVTTAVSSQKNPKLKVGLYGDIRPVDEDTIHSWRLYCLDKHTGQILWERVAHEGVPRIKRHPKSTHANATPVTDGKRVVAFFGSEGLYCYDMKGTLLWKKDLGLLDSGYYLVPSAQWGWASSPIIHNNKLIVQCDVQKNSFIAGFDIRDGREIWRTPRSDVPTWSSPTVHGGARRTQVIVNGYRHIGGYDIQTGQELWRLTGGGDIPVPTPVVADGLIFITNAHGAMAPIYAIRVRARGDISLQGDASSDEYIAWSQKRGGAYMQTPLVRGEYLYSCRNNGVLSCYQAKTGERLYQKRLGKGGGFTASPVSADGKIYFSSEDGDIYVIKAGPEFELLAVNSMGEICMATPAISEGTLFVRTQRHLVAIADQAAPGSN
ncbi:PQQ-binding-like beta-propeller repeat protein [Acidobacteria bacterium AH-259-G07]|nr:PQQ-binding-like beta-propeller repeat protein [Acidobacteria bacterium AH-259-G07]